MAIQQTQEPHLKAEPGLRDSSPSRKVAYIMSRFPKITETFILYEILALEQLGIQVELYPLLREQTTVMHPEARPLVERAHFQPFISWRFLRAHLHYLRYKPGVYFNTLATVLRANWGSFRFFSGALGILPKTVYLAYLMNMEGIQHVHAHFASHPAAAAFIIRRLADIPYSFTAHGSDLHRDRHMLCEKVTEATFVVTISEYNQELILRDCGERLRDKVIVIHCGIDPQIFQSQSKIPRQGHFASPFNILCIGTLHEVKGQTHLIEACRLLRQSGTEFACHFVGDGPDLANLVEQTAQAGLADCVYFHGRRTRQEVVEILQQADVLVAPSVPAKDGRREGIPVVLMEGMGSGLPVVASHLSGIPELVTNNETGLLVPPGDSAALASALKRLYRNSTLRQQLGQAGREKVIREFNLFTNAAALARSFRVEVI